MTRNPTTVNTRSVITTNRNQMIDKPDCLRVPRITAPQCLQHRPGTTPCAFGRWPLLANAAADALEGEGADVVPIEPDEERLSAKVVIGYEAPVTAVVAVVAIVAHHEVMAGRDAADESVLIVIAVAALGERPHVLRINRQR